jgi:hypothetical protein
MTKEQVLQLVGRGSVKEEKIDMLILITVPKPHSAFETYYLIFGPQGLVKIMASAKTLETNGFGQALKDAFLDLRDAVARTYGTPDTYDTLTPGSIWDEPKDWVMGVLKKERALEASWPAAAALKLPNRITAIGITTRALSPSAGYVRLDYFFEGFDSYVELQKARASTVF